MSQVHAEPQTPPPTTPLVLAQHRSMPFTRLIDCGMDQADARVLLATTRAGSASWQEAAEGLAHRQLARARSAAESSSLHTAHAAFRFGAAALLFAQMAYNSDTPEKSRLYRGFSQAIEDAARTSQTMRMEKVSIPHAGGTVRGWLCLPPSGTAVGTAIVWGGLSGWGAAYLSTAEAITARGMACLLAEGPGQGETRLEDGLFFDEHTIAGFGRFVDIVEADPRLRGGIAVHGNSLGGLFAALLASADSRVTACVINGATPSPTVPEFRTAREQMTAAVGSDDLGRVRRVFDSLRFDPSTHRIDCPLLVLVGDADPLAPLPVQQPFVDAGDPARTTVRRWDDGEHTLYNHAAERDAIVADWLLSNATESPSPTPPATTRGVPGSVPADVTEHTVTEAVLRSFDRTADGRLRESLDVLTRRLHDAVRELTPTLPEWESVIDFLTATGQTCTDVRQEFILLSDVLGISSLVENINHRSTQGATQATVLGPFHMTQSPARALGDRISRTGAEQECVVVGTLRSSDGRPLGGALLDVWQADALGFYDVQQPGSQEPGNGRGVFTTDPAGGFWFVTVVPAAYPIPTDGPVGDLLRRTGRHAYRPAHIHFIAQADGYAPVTTHIFVAGSDYLDSDAVFAVKRNLVRDFAKVDDPAQASAYGVEAPFRLASIDLVLDRSAEQQ